MWGRRSVAKIISESLSQYHHVVIKKNTIVSTLLSGINIEKLSLIWSDYCDAYL
jgi:hypothetical protein